MEKRIGQLIAAGVFVLIVAIPSRSPAEPRGGMAGGPTLQGQSRMKDWSSSGAMQMKGMGNPGTGQTPGGPEMGQMNGQSPMDKGMSMDKDMSKDLGNK